MRAEALIEYIRLSLSLRFKELVLRHNEWNQNSYGDGTREIVYCFLPSSYPEPVFTCSCECFVLQLR